jgi:hypothetical protein
MGTAAPFVKLLRQLASAKDDYRTAALDITWDGGSATIFLVFGQPNHAVMEVGGRRLEGTEALAALVTQLPPRFELSPWRKEVVRTETLHCTLEELMEPFAQLAGAASPGAVSPSGSGLSAGVDDGSGRETDFGLADFPLLPLGPSLWADASASVVHLDVLIPSLPDALIVLTGPKLRAAAVVVRQQLIDAVWVDDEDRMVGEAAAMALMGARDGSVSGYRLETPKLAEALTMLWRCRAVYREMPASWVNAASLLEDLEGRRRDSAIVVTGGMRGVALVAGGKLLGVYTEIDRQPVPSPERLSELLRDPRARVTLRQSPEDRRNDHFPETAYHAFVEDAVGAPAPLSEALAALSSSSSRHAGAADQVVAGMEQEPVAEDLEAIAGELQLTAEEVEPAAEDFEPASEALEPAAKEFETATGEFEPAAGERETAAAELETAAGELEPAAAELEPAAAELEPATAELAPAAEEPETAPEEAVPADLMASALVRAAADMSASSGRIAPGEGRVSVTERATPPAEPRAPAPTPAPASWQAPPVESAPTLPVDLGGASGRPVWPPIPLSDPHEEEGALTAWGQPYSQAPAPAEAPEGPSQFSAFDSSPALDALAEADASADFEGMKADLIQIGALWLGTDGVTPVAEILRRTRPSIPDVMAAIEAIKRVALPGFEPSVVQAMAREMHYHAAEYLSGL